MHNNKSKSRKVVANHTTHGSTKEAAKKLKKIASIGAERNYRQCYKNYLDYCDMNNIQSDFRGDIKYLTQYLMERSVLLKQKTLNQMRQSLQLVFQQKIPIIKSSMTTIINKRSYTEEEVNLIISKQNDLNGFTSKLAWHTGIRAHEAATILPLEEQGASKHRDWDTRLFTGMEEYRLYTICGKGGLIRCCAIPIWLSIELESRRRAPKMVTDREIIYESHYEIGSGQSWSQSFSHASKNVLGFSYGAHGLRFSYCKRRLKELLVAFKSNKDKSGSSSTIEDALKVLSQEVGHFRIDILFYYLR